MVDKQKIKLAKNIAMAILAVITVGFIIYGINAHLFTSQSALEAFLTKFGILAFLVFVIYQAIQVVFPIIPGGLGLLAGVIICGSWTGFLYNYIGICIGSIIAFLIARHYGTPIIQTLFSEKMQQKYMKWAESKMFPKLFAIAIFMPIAPDDFLCYLAGTTKMTLKKFSTIIVLGKPMAIATYSYGLAFLFRHILLILH